MKGVDALTIIVLALTVAFSAWAQQQPSDAARAAAIRQYAQMLAEANDKLAGAAAQLQMAQEELERLKKEIQACKSKEESKK